MGIFTKKIDSSAGKSAKGGFNLKKKTSALVILVFLIGLLAAFFNYPQAWNQGADWVNGKLGLEVVPHFIEQPFKLGLDLQGGTHLVYEADLSNIAPEAYSESMQGVRDVIERRVNMFGVTEPVVQVNKSGSHYRLIVELAGIKDANQAIEMIGQTPALDFRQERDENERENILSDQEEARKKIEEGLPVTEEEQKILLEDPYFEPTKLTGRYLERAQLEFDQQTYQPSVSLEFNDEGSQLFEQLTSENKGKRIAIYLDGSPISAPVVQEAITGGKAQITGGFSTEEAKELVQRLNAGALPVPIKLVNQQTIGASLGKLSLEKSLKAGLWGFLAILLFLIFYYRMPGILASFALFIYIAVVLALFKLIPVTLTLAGIAGFILSIGMAVDANVLIFERFKEERKAGKSLGISIEEGFARAWPAIRDGNISTVITCIILFIFATGLVKGFALTLGIGVIVSMISAILVTKTFLRFFVGKRIENSKWLWG